MDRPAPSGYASRDAGHHGDHVLQGGHAILKGDEDTAGQDANVSNAGDSGASKQSRGLGATRPGDFQASTGSSTGFGDGMRQRSTQSHVGPTEP
ncbi:hypothetical protein Trco_007800 [Trichoderma cornu-damae]|uniref:Uncharacterized protein n=1 Tax=Trichoderma cornu-damae TaxID=654480 RepID=A0A9P8TTE2_9HYPO|nr:hypothetical protein Trco_007800 [Trichoderma cornu-damae]